MAIGAQHAFVLRQGLRRQHVLAVVAICALTDAVLMFSGTAGLGAVITANPSLLRITTWGGAAFLIAYGIFALQRALRPRAMEVGDEPPMSLRAAVLACLGFTFLNPHVYLDTVVLVGTLANQHGPDGRWVFATGAALASVTWFSALGWGARLLTPVFARPNAWRILDGAIALVMFTLAILLLAG